VSFSGATTNSTYLVGSLQPQVYSTQYVTTGSYTTTGYGTVSLSFNGVPSGLFVGFNTPATQTLSIPITTDPSSFGITLSYYHTGMSAGNFSFNVISTGGTQSTTFTVYFTISYNPVVTFYQASTIYAGTTYYISVTGGMPNASYSLDTGGSAGYYINNGSQILDNNGSGHSLSVKSIANGTISAYNTLLVDIIGSVYTVGGGPFYLYPAYTINFSSNNFNIVETQVANSRDFNVYFYFTPATTSIATSDEIYYNLYIYDSNGYILLSGGYTPYSVFTFPFYVMNGQAVYYYFNVYVYTNNANLVAVGQILHP
jgi:hypothetical protein